MSGVSIGIRIDSSALSRALQDVARNQLPFAIAQSLTAAAKLAQGAVTRQVPTTFDRPNPFTRRAVAITPATKANLTATVFIRPDQAKYLLLEETGGTRTPPKTALVMPVDIRLNAYGNIPNKALQRAKARGNVFVGQVHGIGGFWLRKKDGHLELLAAFRSKATYKPRFHFREQVETSVRANLPVLLRASLARAIATSRR